MQTGGTAEDARELAAQRGGAAPPFADGPSIITSLADQLTAREQEILEQLVEGKSNKEIGENLFIAPDTVKSHLKKIYQKLEVKSRLQAVAKAQKLGFAEKDQ